MQEPELPEGGPAYCRTVTVAWCWFFAVNAGVSLGLAAIGAGRMVGAVHRIFGVYPGRARLHGRVHRPQAGPSAASGLAARPPAGPPAAVTLAHDRRASSTCQSPRRSRRRSRPRSAAAGGRGRRGGVAHGRGAAARRAGGGGRLPPAGPGSEVLVVCGDRYHVAVAVLAAWQAGTRWRCRRTRRRRRCGRCGAPGVVALLHDTDAEGAPTCGRGSPQEAPEEVRRARPGAGGDRGRPGDGDGVHVGQHRGAPGVPEDGGAIARRGGGAGVAASGSARGQRVIATVPPHHLYGLLFSVLMPLAAGASFVRETPLHAETVAATARRPPADVLVSVPVHLRSLTVLAAGELPRFARVFSSGAALPGRRRRRWRALGPGGDGDLRRVGDGGIAWRRHSPDQSRRGRGGRFTGVSGGVRPTRAGGCCWTRRFCRPTRRGRDRVRGPGRALRRTGRFHLLGRYDGVMKIGGKRVALAEVEARLLALPGLVDAAVAAIEVGGPRGL
jgi:hypothetical protein